MKIQHCEDHKVLRAKEYPPIGDQLDAILKMALALKTQGVNLPIETDEWINQCLVIKNKYKKSSNN